MLLNPIDPEPYVRAPRLAVDTGLSLAKKLLQVVPSKPSAGVQQGAELIADAVAALETAWHANGKAQPARSARPADLRLDRAWGAVNARLVAWTIFPSDDPDHETSRSLAERLFPTGLDFLRLPYLAEHAQSERRLRIIDDEGLRPDLDHLVGEVFMEELSQAHADYGDALGITKATATTTPEQRLDEPLRMLSQSIVAYAMQLIAFAALPPGHVEEVQRALRPIDELRAAAGRRSAGGPARDDEEPQDEPAEGQDLRSRSVDQPSRPGIGRVGPSLVVEHHRAVTAQARPEPHLVALRRGRADSNGLAWLGPGDIDEEQSSVPLIGGVEHRAPVGCRDDVAGESAGVPADALLRPGFVPRDVDPVHLGHDAVLLGHVVEPLGRVVEHPVVDALLGDQAVVHAHRHAGEVARCIEQVEVEGVGLIVLRQVRDPACVGRPAQSIEPSLVGAEGARDDRQLRSAGGQLDEEHVPGQPRASPVDERMAVAGHLEVADLGTAERIVDTNGRGRHGAGDIDPPVRHIAAAGLVVVDRIEYRLVPGDEQRRLGS
ncbi:MAG: hypothetical protein AB1Z98_08065 [Nannocystaceae bacterium]